MSAVIAKTAMGFCSCGVRIEAGEMVRVTNGNATHAGCQPRQTENKSRVTETRSSGFLFADPERAETQTVKETVGTTRVVFHGATYDRPRDKARLTKHLITVLNVMRDGEYRTTVEIAEAANCLETTAHARLRQLRASGYRVPKRHEKDSNGRGVFKYAVLRGNT